MQIGIYPNNYSFSPNFSGVKMTSASRKDTTKLLQQYLNTPTLKLRDEIFEIMDPYMQRHAQKFATKGYYYNDVLQNIRLNLFELLDTERIKSDEKKSLLDSIAKAKRRKNCALVYDLQKEYDRLPEPITTADKLKLKLIHYEDNTTNAKIPQKDSSLVLLGDLSTEAKEKLMPDNTIEKQEEKETLNYIWENARLSDVERNILNDFFFKGMSLDEMACRSNISSERIRQLKGRALQRIRDQFNIKIEKKEIPTYDLIIKEEEKMPKPVSTVSE